MQTSSLYRVTKRIQAIMEGASDLPFKEIYYGDQNIIPATPSASIIPRQQERIQTNTGTRVDNMFQVDIIIFHSSLQDTSVTQEECDQLAESVADVLDKNRKLSIEGDELVADGFVTLIEPGWALRGVGTVKQVLRASKVTWQGITKTDRSVD